MEGFELESLQMKISVTFFAFTLLFVAFALLLFFQRYKPWCSCHVCKSYLNSSWRTEFQNLSDWYAHLLRQSPTQTVQIHVLGATITANVDNVEYMLKTRFDNFPKGKPFSSILGDLLGRGIFNVDGELWKFQRKMASLELGSVSVRSFAFSITKKEIRQRLVPLLSKVVSNINAEATVVVVDLQDVFRRFTFDTICKISFGLDPCCLDLSLPMSEFANAFDLATGISARRAVTATPIVWKIKRLLNWGSEKELKRAIGLVDSLAEEVIRQKRKLGFSSDGDLLSRFMGSVNDDKYLRDIVISFLLAGRDTVASGLTTFFLLISKHPEVVAKMREEIDSCVLGKTKRESDDDDDDGLVSFDQLRSMNYVHAAVYESLRLYPPVQFDSKFCLEDDILPDGTFVKKNERVTYHPYAMGRMETIWGTDCGVFRPERWLDGGVFVPESPYRYPVFQGGTRVCLGKEMALMEMKAVVVSIVREFDIDVVGSGTLPPRFAAGLTASVSGGLACRVRRRRSSLSETVAC